MSPANPATTRTAWGVTWAPLSGFAGPPRPACGGCPWLWVSLKHGASGHPYTSALAACRPGETRVPPQLCPWHSPASPASSERGPALYAGSTCRCPLGRWWDRGPGGEGGGAPPCRSRPRARGARRSGCTESSGLVWPRGWRGPRPSALDQKRVRRRRARHAKPCAACRPSLRAGGHGGGAPVPEQARGARTNPGPCTPHTPNAAVSPRALRPNDAPALSPDPAGRGRDGDPITPVTAPAAQSPVRQPCVCSRVCLSSCLSLRVRPSVCPSPSPSSRTPTRLPGARDSAWRPRQQQSRRCGRHMVP